MKTANQQHTANACVRVSAIMVIAVFMQSCGTPAPFIIDESRQRQNHYYKLSQPNTQLLRNKNEISMSGNQCLGDLVGEISAGYLLTNNFGFVASYAGGETNRGNVEKTEIGTGFVIPLRSWAFETYGGYGFGNYSNTHSTGSSTLKHTSYFIQPTIVKSWNNENLQLAFSSRINRIHTNITNRTFNIQREPTTLELLQAFDNKTHVYFEPCFISRYGWKNFLFTLQWSKGIQLDGTDVVTGPISVNIGGALRFNLSKKQQKE